MTDAAAVRSARDLWVLVVLGFFGIYSLALGLYMAVAPGSFYETLGPFGERNDHYIRDASTFGFANALLLLLAIRRSAWRVPALVFTAFQWVLHALNHLWDIGESDPAWVGVFDFVALAAGFVVLGSALFFATRDVTGERAAT